MPRESIGWGHVAIYFAILSVGLAAGTFVGSGWPAADWSAAAQAFAGLVGIGVAIWVPWSQRQSQIDDERRKEAELRQVMALALRQPIRTFLERCGIFRRWITNDEIPKTKVKTVFKRPPEFDQFRAHLHLLGEVGSDVNRLIGLQADVWVLWEAIRINDEVPPELFKVAVDVLDVVGPLTIRCLHGLDVVIAESH